MYTRKKCINKGARLPSKSENRDYIGAYRKWIHDFDAVNLVFSLYQSLEKIYENI